MSLVANLVKDKWFLKQVKLGKLKVYKSGKVINTKTNSEIGKPGKSVYCYIALTVSNQTYQILKHRLVWIVFKGLILDPLIIVNHEDGNKFNCALNNLNLKTDSGNKKHAYKIGLRASQKGELNYAAKLTAKDLVKLCNLYKTGRYTYKQLAKKFNLCKVYVGYLIRKQNRLRFKELV